VSDSVDQLIARSNRLGADPTTTNYAGGNTSAKGAETDPVTGAGVELVWVKGSGGDLGTLTPANAVFVLVAGELSHTTGMHIPVDAGVAAAFLR
jgi:rhamnose utilization protein RhaD (predicted bifunctional aldolase and dehydrogenase)